MFFQFSKFATGNDSEVIQRIHRGHYQGLPVYWEVTSHSVYYVLNEWSCSMHLIEWFILGERKKSNVPSLLLQYLWWWYSLLFFIMLHLYLLTHSDHNIRGLHNTCEPSLFAKSTVAFQIIYLVVHYPLFFEKENLITRIWYGKNCILE
jgi:hypothetical protein